MSLSTKTVSSLLELKELLAAHTKALFYSSKSSTVIPFSQLERYYQEGEMTLVNLSALPKSIELKGDILEIEGPLTWQEARDFCHRSERELPLWPTEESACVLAGLATSATGERSFHSGSLSDQVLEITYLDKNGAEKVLSSDRPFVDGEILTEYQKSHAPYRKFKNAPFPRLERETDLMIGSEGQLGVIISAKLKTLPLKKK